ncbi:unnamed protein product [Closterium sp. Naga37s-1]|nr:unnamed protein product [Closterium sp. Naga37s-1]
MGKRKSAAKPEARRVQKVPTTFNCPFCNHEASLECKLDRNAGIGTVSCRVCSEQYQTTIDNLSEPIDLAYTLTSSSFPRLSSTPQRNPRVQKDTDSSRYLPSVAAVQPSLRRLFVKPATIPHVPSINLSSEALTMTDVSSALREQQKLLQSARALTHMKGPGDRITSVVIPSVLALTAAALIGRGLFNMSFGIGKKE